MRIDLNKEKGIYAFINESNVTINCKTLEDKKYFEPFISEMIEKNKDYKFFLNFLNRSIQQNIEGITVLDKIKPYINQKIKTLGKLVDLDKRTTKSGWIIYIMSFDVIGHHKRFKGKIFIKPGADDNIAMKVGRHYVVTGKIIPSKDPIKKSEHIMGIKEKYEMSVDTYEDFDYIDENESVSYEKSRAELHCHTYMSKNDAFITEDDVKLMIKQNKLNSMAITDHGVTWAFLKFVNSLKDYKDKFKLILGSEVYASNLTSYKKTRQSELDMFEITLEEKRMQIEEFESLIEEGKEKYKALGLQRSKANSALKRKGTTDEEKIMYESEVEMYDRAREEIKNLEKDMKSQIKDFKDMLEGAESRRAYLESEIEHPNDSERDHLTILIKSQDEVIDYRGEELQLNPGLVALYEIISESNLKTFSTPIDPNNKRNGKRPIADYDSIFRSDRRKHFIIGSACAFGRHMKLAVENKWDEFREWIKKLDYVEIQPLHNNSYMVEHEDYPNINSIDDVKELHKTIFKICIEENVDVVITSDAHVNDRKDRDFRANFKAGYIGRILKGKGEVGDESDFSIEKQPFVLSYNDCINELKEQGFNEEEVKYIMSTTQKIADQCANGLEITTLPKKLFIPEFPGINVKEEVPRLAWEFAINKWSKDGTKEGIDPKIKQRLEDELEATSNGNFEFLYYASYWTCRESEKYGYVVGSRGSAGSTILNYCLQIGENNPLGPHYYCENCKEVEWVNSETTGVDLPNKKCGCGSIMEGDGLNIESHNFLGWNNVKVPDIDMNLSPDIQTIIHKNLIDIMTSENAIKSGTIMLNQSDSLKKDVLAHITNISEKIRDEEIDIDYMADNILTAKSSGQHPGGVIVKPVDAKFEWVSPLQYASDEAKKGIVTDCYDYHSIEEQLIKLDILGHDTPTAMKEMTELTGINFKSIKFNDPKMYEIMMNPELIGIKVEDLGCDTFTLGISELNTDVAIQMLKELKPKNFTELAYFAGFAHKLFRGLL